MILGLILVIIVKSLLVVLIGHLNSRLLTSVYLLNLGFIEVVAKAFV